MKRCFALVDCNNFYVSCERIFRPELEHRPVVVLSNNDGCLIARSNEVKAMGLRMGEPWFRCRSTLERHNTTVFSSNFSLYGDISSRISQLLEEWFPHVEVYSIDEAFLEWTMLGGDWESLGKEVRSRLWKWVGVPVSVGVGETKTLAKVASRIAKKKPSGVHVLWTEEERRRALCQTPVGDVWGVGPASVRKLARRRIHNALELSEAREEWIRKEMTIQGVRLLRELRGEVCFELEEQPAPRKTMVHSRTFPSSLSEREAIQTAVAHYTSQLANKLYKHEQVAGYIQLFLSSPRWEDGLPPLSWSQGIQLEEATNYAPTLVKATRKLFSQLYLPYTGYRKVGVMASHLQPVSESQLSLWHDREKSEKEERLMEAMAGLRKKHGHKALFLGSEMGPKTWKMRQNLRSPRYTTRWEDILCISLDSGHCPPTSPHAGKKSS